MLKVFRHSEQQFNKSIFLMSSLVMLEVMPFLNQNSFWNTIVQGYNEYYYCDSYNKYPR